jgi:hypothetical protein
MVLTLLRQDRFTLCGFNTVSMVDIVCSNHCFYMNKFWTNVTRPTERNLRIEFQETNSNYGQNLKSRQISLK